MYCLVSPFSHTFDTIGLIYFVPDFLSSSLEVGKIVEIPYKENIVLAVVLEINSNIGDTPEEKIKSLISIKNENIFLSKSQIEILRFVSQYYFTPISNAANLYFPKNLLEKIAKSTFVDFSTKNSYFYKNNHEIILSEKQSEVFQKINSGEDKKYLLYGITGSGKTQIYIELIKKQLQNNKQSLLLIPEIILSNQISQSIKNVFGDDVLIINSTVSAAKKTQYFCDIHTNKAKIIIGTRSALFYPYNNLGIIIVDEEHDNSYISDQAPRYHALDIVNKISDINNIKLVLASGTPSVKTMYDAMKKKYTLVTLLEKYKKPE